MLKCSIAPSGRMIQSGVAFLAMALFVFASGQVFAAQEKDRRITLDSHQAPWSSIGHINIAGYRTRRRCTGTLIAPNAVLTAAHCVFDAARGTPFEANLVHFVAGVRKEKTLAHARGKCLHLPDYVSAYGQGKRKKDLIGTDIALVILDRDITLPPLAASSEYSVTKKTRLAHPSYPARRRYMLAGDMNCRLNKKDSRLFLTSCQTFEGSSGGPLLAKLDDKYELTGVMVAKTTDGRSLAVQAARFKSLLKKQSCEKSK